MSGYRPRMMHLRFKWLTLVALVGCLPAPSSDGPGEGGDGATCVPSGSDDSCDGLDNDCDGQIDEDAGLAYPDKDGDGYGDETQGMSACDAPVDYISQAGDCDDADSDAFPGNEEVCDGVDQDCDGNVDFGAVDGDPYYYDADDDGYGDPSAETWLCEQQEGYSEVPGDCDEEDNQVHPGAVEDCNDGADTDCDGAIDNCRLGTVLPYESPYAAGAILGVQELSGFGRSLEAGKILGGTSRQVVVSASEYDTALSGAGSVYIAHFGDGSGLLAENVVAKGGVQIVGESEFEYLGLGLKIVDWDDDGKDDLIVSNRREWIGGVDIWLGPLTSGSYSSSQADISFEGISAGGQSNSPGSAMTGMRASGGTVDSLLLGDPTAYGTSGGDTYGMGMVLGMPLGSDGPPYRLGQAATFMVVGEKPYTYCGRAVVAYDRTGDGIDDVAFGCPGEEDDSGVVYVFDGPVSGIQSVGDARSRLVGQGNAAYFGASLANAGDLDRDGREDLAVGAPYRDNPDSSAASDGAVYFFRFIDQGEHSAEIAEARVIGEYGESVGNSLAPMGDLDSDGYPEILVGAPQGTPAGYYGGAAGVVYGPINGTHQSGRIDGVLALDAAYAGLGESVLGVADLTGDSVPDLLVGAPYLVGGASIQTGAVYLYDGAAVDDAL